jgi:hypothetical protein
MHGLPLILSITSHKRLLQGWQEFSLLQNVPFQEGMVEAPGQKIDLCSSQGS